MEEESDAPMGTSLDEAVETFELDELESPEADEESETLEDETPDAEDEAAEEVDEEEADGEVQMVALDSGEEVPLDELKKGYFREADYTKKTTEHAERVRSFEQEQAGHQERVKFVDQTLSKLTEFLQGVIPPEPDANLAYTNPGAYTQAKALREQALAELGQLTAVQDEYAQGQQAHSQQDMDRYLSAQSDKLNGYFSFLKEPGRREAFDKANEATAAAFEFGPEEFAQTKDARILRMLHYAGLGLKAEKNRKAAKSRVEAPKKARTTKRKAQPQQDRTALERLKETGSLEDAMRIDV